MLFAVGNALVTVCGFVWAAEVFSPLFFPVVSNVLVAIRFLAVKGLREEGLDVGGAMGRLGGMLSRIRFTHWRRLCHRTSIANSLQFSVIHLFTFLSLGHHE